MIRMGALGLLIFYLPNALHLPLETGVPGLNVSNTLFIVALLAILLNGPDQYGALIQRRSLRKALFIWFTALAVGFVIAQLRSPLDVGSDLVSLKNAIFFPLLYFVFLKSHLDSRQTRWLIIFVMVVAAVAGIEAVREGLDYGLGNYSPTHRASGPFGVDFRNANRAGVFYAMFLPVFVSLSVYLRGIGFWRIAAIIASAITVVAILATFSRQAYAVSVITIGILLLRRNVFVGMVLVALLASAIPFLPEGVTERVERTEQSDVAGIESLDASTTSRFDIWAGAVKMWNDYPAGVGINRFKQHIGDYSLHAGYDAHNYYVLTIAELGPQGLFALLIVIFAMLRLAAFVNTRASDSGDIERIALARGFGMMIIAMALGNLYGSPFSEGSVMANFWILCGLMERYTQLKGTSAKSVSGATENHFSRHAIGEKFPLARRVLPKMQLKQPEKNQKNA